MVVTDLPAGGKIRLTIFRAGVYFPDGTTVRVFDADDLNDGVLDLEFLVIDGLGGGFCHYIDILDAAGNVLSRR